jgi:hypothetical protein
MKSLFADINDCWDISKRFTNRISKKREILYSIECLQNYAKGANSSLKKNHLG